MPRSLRVVHVIHSGAIGGGPAVVLSLATHLPADHVIMAADDGPLLHDAASAGAKVIPLRHTGKYSFPLSTREIARAARQAGIVHVHGQFAAFYAGPVARAAGAAVVYTAHFPSFVTDWSPGKRVRNRLVEAISVWSASTTVACCQTMRGEYIRRGLAGTGRITTIYNGVAPDGPTRTRELVLRELGIEDPARIVLAVGRFTEQKGFDVLLDAFSDVVRRIPDALLLLAGDGERRRALEQQATELGLASSVRFLGFRRDSRELMHASEVVVVPSRYDVFPLVPLEAMMAARPVVGSSLPVLREAIEPNVTGLLAEPAPGPLAGSIVQILSDPAAAARMGRAGREQAEARFGVDQMVQSYAQLYDRVLCETHGRR